MTDRKSDDDFVVLPRSDSAPDWDSLATALDRTRRRTQPPLPAELKLSAFQTGLPVEFVDEMDWISTRNLNEEGESAEPAAADSAQANPPAKDEVAGESKPAGNLPSSE